jgi:hypothetical protein
MGYFLREKEQRGQSDFSGIPLGLKATSLPAKSAALSENHFLLLQKFRLFHSITNRKQLFLYKKAGYISQEKSF